MDTEFKTKRSRSSSSKTGLAKSSTATKDSNRNRHDPVNPAALSEALSTAAKLAAASTAPAPFHTFTQPTALPSMAPKISQQQFLPPNLFPGPTLVPNQRQQQGQPRELRSGKWTTEEEEYANVLIQEFERGTLEDCDNGCTLRSYLSRKLRCAPMRISKKYAGRSIGKQIFLSRLNLPHGKRSMSAESRHKMKALESNFLRSLMNDVQPSLQGYHPGLPGPPLSMPRNISAGSFFPHPIQMTPGMVVPFVPQYHLQGAPTMQTKASTSCPAGAPSSGPQPPSKPSTRTTSTDTNDKTQRLQQTYLIALDQMKANFTRAKALQTAQGTASGAAASTETAATLTTAAKICNPASRGNYTTSMKIRKPAGASSVPTSLTVEVPDLLSGFDKISSNKTTSNEKSEVVKEGKQKQLPFSNLFHGDNHFSPSLAGGSTPVFTSRSFDDFHKLLGHNCSPSEDFDLNSGSKPVSSTDPGQDGSAAFQPPNILGGKIAAPAQAPLPLVQDASVAADCYTMFAQQSVIAVSQHSAYRANEIPPTGFNMGSSAPTLSMPKGQVPYHRAPTVAPRSPDASINAASTMVNSANLRAHARANLRQSDLGSSSSSSLESSHRQIQSVLQAMTQEYSSRDRNIVSASERSSEYGTEESGSVRASLRESSSDSNTNSSDDPFDNTSNDSDSMSDDRPRRKKQKIAHSQAETAGGAACSPQACSAPVSPQTQ